MAESNGITLVEALARLVPQKRGPGRLDPAPAREAIAVSIAEAVPSGATDSATGIVGPLIEQAFIPGDYYFQTSSDGLFVIEFPEYTDYLDADSTTLRFNHIDPNA
jgi:hypothetical protein